MFNFFKKMCRRLRKPSTTVRTIDMRSGSFIYGKVVGERQVPKHEDVVTYWNVKWEDREEPSTVPSWNFVWYDGYWTLVERK